MWWIQDASAAWPVRLFGNLQNLEVADLCAAPGGKTAQLAAQGAYVTALDRSASRLKRLCENMNRLNLQKQVTPIVADAAHWIPQKAFPAILLDAPCSSTGVIRRHPDILHLKRPEDVQALSRTQATLLTHACNILANEGTLIYCTCSLQPEEGEDQIDALLSNRSDMRRIPITPSEIGNMEQAITLKGDVRILPHFGLEYGGYDGFFISRLQKTV